MKKRLISIAYSIILLTGCQSKLDDPFYRMVYENNVQGSKSCLSLYKARVVYVETNSTTELGEYEHVNLYEKNGNIVKTMFNSNSQYSSRNSATNYYYDLKGRFIRSESFDDNGYGLKLSEIKEYEYNGDLLESEKYYNVKNGEKQKSRVTVFNYEGDEIIINEIDGTSSRSSRLYVDCKSLRTIYKFETELQGHCECITQYKIKNDGKFEELYSVNVNEDVSDTTFYNNNEVVVERYENGDKKIVRVNDRMVEAYDEHGNKVYYKTKDTETKIKIVYAESDDDYKFVEKFMEE